MYITNKFFFKYLLTDDILKFPLDLHSCHQTMNSISYSVIQSCFYKCIVAWGKIETTK